MALATCPHCREAIPQDAPAGLCPRCLMAGAKALARETDGSSSGPREFSSTGLGGPRDVEGGRVGDYELVRRLAHGGMGVVYEARQLSTGRTVAVKMIRGGEHATLEEGRRFQTEVEAAACLDHPHIVPIYEVGHDRHGPYFSMKLLKGGSLADSLCRGEWRAELGHPEAIFRRAARLMACVARAIHHAHQHGILHRDLKPANVLLDIEGQPVVSDFGLAKFVDREQGATKSGQVMGTPAYMAPEQADTRTHAITTAADIYSMGAILYELMTGRVPFPASQPQLALNAVLHDEPRRPGAVIASVPRDLETICLKCLEKNPAGRYGSAEALADDLDRWLRHEPIAARPSTPWSRVGKWARRKPAIAALLSALIATALIGLAGVLWQLRQKVAALRESERARQQAQAVSRFLVSSFRSPDPRKEGRDLKVVELLDRASGELTEQRLAEETTRAELLDALGQTYGGLGFHSRSAELHAAALKLRRAELGPAHPETVASLNNLAEALQAEGKFEQALPFCEEAFRLADATLGREHADTLTSMSNLATAREGIGRRSEAIAMTEQVLSIRRRRWGPTARQTLSSANNLAMMYLEDDQTAKALPMLEEVLKLAAVSLGESDPDALASLNNLATGYQAAGRPEEALPLLEKAWALTKKKLGDDHPDTLGSMNNLALGYLDSRRPEDAVHLQESAAEIARSRLGTNHAKTLTSLNNLAVIYDAAGRRSNALALFEQVYARRRERLGPDHPQTLASLHDLATHYYESHRRSEALSLFEEAVRRRRSVLGSEHSDTLKSMNNLGLAYQNSGRLVDAIPLLEETVRSRRGKLGPNDPRTAVSLENLADAYQAAGRSAESMAVFAEVLSVRRSKAGANHPETANAAVKLAGASLDAGEFVRAETALREALRIFDAGDSQRAAALRARAKLGAALLGQDRYSEAEPFLVQAYQNLSAREARASASRTRLQRDAAQKLVSLYEAWGHAESATQWKQKVRDLEQRMGTNGTPVTALPSNGP